MSLVPNALTPREPTPTARLASLTCSGLGLTLVYAPSNNSFFSTTSTKPLRKGYWMGTEQFHWFVSASRVEALRVWNDKLAERRAILTPPDLTPTGPAPELVALRDEVAAKAGGMVVSYDALEALGLDPYKTGARLCMAGLADRNGHQGITLRGV